MFLVRSFLRWRGRILALACSLPALAAPLYEQDFSKVTGDQVPDEIMVLDGQFTVKEEGGNRFLELPGAPLETFGVLFGPSEAAGVQAEARVLATKTGRKFPTFAVGLNGVSGFKLRVAPAKSMVEIVQADEIRATATFPWKSGEWVNLRLQVLKEGAGLRVRGMAWQGSTAPAEWTVTWTASEALPAGKAGIWGMPFSGTPIRFDDLRVARVEP